MNLFDELKRRRVFRVVAAYAVVAWFLLQLADILLGNFGAPEWVFKSFAALLALGLPLALFLSWAYDLTPAGVVRADAVAAENSAIAPPGRRIHWLFVATLSLLALAAASLTWLAQTDAFTSAPRAARASLDGDLPVSGPLFANIEAPAGTRIHFTGDLAGPPAVSPDGRAVAFSASRQGELRRLWVRRLDQPTARELVGTEGAMFPFWSPDGSELAYFDGVFLQRYDLASGTAEKVVEVGAARGGAYTDDGRIIYTHDFRSGLSIVDVGGGAPAALTELDQGMHTSHRWPFVIPGTGRYLFVAVTAIVSDAANNGIYLGSLGSDAPPTRIMASDFSAAFAHGRLLHVRDGVLLATHFDLDGGRVQGRSTVLARGVAPDLSIWHAQFSVSRRSIALFYQQTGTATGDLLGNDTSATVGDRVSSYSYDGRLNTTYASGLPMFSMALHPGGRMLALDVLSPDGQSDIWIHQTGWMPVHDAIPRPDRIPPPQRLTFLPGRESMPTWSADGREVAFHWDGDDANPRGLYRKRLGAGAHTLVRESAGSHDSPSDWTADGAYLVVSREAATDTDGSDIVALALDDGREITLVADPGPQHGGRVSPDGRWLAYEDTSQRPLIYVVPFAPAWSDGELDRKWLVSEPGAHLPRWSREGDELFYMTETGTLVAIDVDTTGELFVHSGPRVLFQSPWRPGRSYDPTPDGEVNPNGFVFVDSEAPPDAPVSLILNWQSLLQGN